MQWLTIGDRGWTADRCVGVTVRVQVYCVKTIRPTVKFHYLQIQRPI